MHILTLYTIPTIDYNIANNHTIVIVYDTIYTIVYNVYIYHTIVETYYTCILLYTL